MAKRNKPTDVFLHICTHDGDYNVCWEWTGSLGGRRDQQRPYFTLDGKKELAYRVIYKLVNGEDSIPQGHMVRHTCDNGICCNPSHLIIGSHEENMSDMRERERHGLPHHTIRRIRALAADGETHKAIGEKYGVARRTVTDIVNRKTYKEVS